MIRPEARVALVRWREVIAAAATGLLALWMGSYGGYLLLPAGGMIAVASLAWGIVAARRLRFETPVDAPGLVEVDEGQVGYFGPTFGGMVALADIDELRLTEWHGARQWRLRTGDGQVLLIPEGARGAERLFDAFATLPGIDLAALTRAHAAPRPPAEPLWRRARAAAVLTGHHEIS